MAPGKIKEGIIKIFKIWGGHNPANLLTKHLTKEKMEQFLKIMHIETRGDRHAEAPNMQNGN